MASTGPHHGQHGDGCYSCAHLFNVPPPRGRPSPPPKPRNNSWEKGVLRDHRGLPVLRNGKVIPLKEAAADRHNIEAGLRKLKQGL